MSETTQQDRHVLTPLWLGSGPDLRAFALCRTAAALVRSEAETQGRSTLQGRSGRSAPRTY